MFDLKGRTVVITGASSDWGKQLRMHMQRLGLRY